jgi:hypothetical protein
VKSRPSNKLVVWSAAFRRPGSNIFNQRPQLAEIKQCSYIAGVICLTKQEWRVLGVVLILLATGWATKTYRATQLVAPPAAVVIPQARP